MQADSVTTGTTTVLLVVCLHVFLAEMEIEM